MKTTITRSQLGDIYEIACKDWKTKIKEYGSKNPFSETIEFTEKQVNEMVSACTAEQLPVVKAIFEIKDITKEIKTLEDAIKYLGEKDEETLLLNRMEGLPRHIVAEQEIVVITKALNEKYVLDWDNHSESKYFLWWCLGKNFRLCNVDCYSSSSVCSSRLCFKSREVAEYAAQQFKETYKDFMNK